MLVIYGAAKFIAYSCWCQVGLRLVRPVGAGRAAALRLGAVRWLLGLGFGVAVFFAAGSIDAADVASTYVAIYTPVRAIEWSIVAFLIVRDRAPGPRSGESAGSDLIVSP